LVVFGDHLSSGIPGPNWQNRFDDCRALITRIGAANGNAEMLYPREIGIHGSSHMIMQDKNNLQIADLILKWIDDKADKKQDKWTPRKERCLSDRRAPVAAPECV
jgi:hypothetical protein